MRTSRGLVVGNMGTWISLPVFYFYFYLSPVLCVRKTVSGFDFLTSGDSYIISVIHITNIGEGKIMPSTGQARFKTSYTAVVMKPFKGEVVDGKVVNVNKVSLNIREMER